LLEFAAMCRCVRSGPITRSVRAKKKERKKKVHLGTKTVRTFHSCHKQKDDSKRILQERIEENLLE